MVKAARGAGRPWGIAEEAGWAAEWLARRGWPAAEAVSEWLAAPDDPDACPVALGLELAEGSAPPAGPVRRVEVAAEAPAPLLALPFLARAARAWGQDARLAWRNGSLEVSREGEVAAQPGGRGLVGPGRPRLDPGLIAALEVLALRTTVPSSDGSRGDAGPAGEDEG